MKIYGPDGRPVLESAEQRMDAAMASIQKSLMSAIFGDVNHVVLTDRYGHYDLPQDQSTKEMVGLGMALTGETNEQT